MGSKIVKRYFDISKFVIWGDRPTDDPNAKSPSMTFSFRDGNPRFVVYTGVTGPEGVINFPCDYPTMVSVISILRDVIKGEPGEKVAIDSLTGVYKDNKPTGEKRILSTLYIGKSKEGLIYFSVISENRPKLVFTIKKSVWHEYRDSNKTPVADAKISQYMATGLADLILNMISHVMVNYSMEEYDEGKKQTPIKPPGGPNGAGGAKGKAEMITELDSLDL